MEKKQLYYEDVEVGMEMDPIVKGPMTTMHIMRWCASMENWHRIHYDKPFALGHEGLPDILVNGSWKQHVMVQLVKDWVGTEGWVWKVSFQFRELDVVGDTIIGKGKVIKKSVKDDVGLIECEIWLENQKGVKSTTGTAMAVLPLKGKKPIPYPFRSVS